MRVTKLTGQAIKGRSFSHDLAPVTLFYGPNFAGKSARVEALTLALAGWLPGVEKTNAKIFERLASGSEMMVSVSYDRDLAAQGKAPYNKDTFRNYSQRNGSVKYTGADGLVLPPVAIDATEFLGLGGPDRVRFLFKQAAMRPEWTHSALAAAIAANVKNIKPEGGCTAETEAVANELATLLSDGMIRDSKVSSVQDCVANAVDYVRNKKKEADQNWKRLGATVQGLAQVADAEPPPADAEQLLADAKRKQLDAEQARAKVWAEHTVAEADVKESEVARGWIEGTEAAELVENLRTAVAVLKAFETSPAEEPGPQDKVSVNLKCANTSYSVAMKNEEAAKQVIKNLDEKIAELETDIKKAEKVCKCPTCGQDTTDIQKKITKRLEKELLGLKGELNKEAKPEHDKAIDLLNEAAEELNNAQVASDAWHIKNKAFQDWQDQFRKASGVVAELRQKLESTASLRATADKLTARVALRDWASAEYRNTQIWQEQAKAEVSKRDVEFKRLLAARAEQASIAKAAEQKARAKAEAEVYKLAAEMLGEMQGKMVDEAVGGLLARANEVCGGILTAPLTYKDGEVGMVRPTGFVSWKTFSGTERALSFCALSVALAADAPVRIVILDEVGRLDSRNKERLYAALCGLTAGGKLDNAVVVDTVGYECASDQFKAIEVRA